MLRIILFGLLFVQLRCAPAPFDCKREDVDFMGADIGYRTAISIQECIDYCKDTEGCVSFTYRDSTKSCWMKNKRGGQRGPTVQGGLVSMNMDCTDTKSDQSCLQENTDFWGADLASGRAINLDQCETFCRDTRDCVSITYRSSDSQCWLKYNRFGAAGPSNKNGLTSLNMECKVAPQNETCKRIDVDFWGADIGHVIAESLDKCEELCRETEGCVSLTYRASSNSCWRKNKRGGQRGPTVQGGLVSMNMDCTDTKSDQSCLQENTDFWGADLASGRAINLDQCETFCRDTRDCVSITYRSSDSQCWLKYNRFGAAGPSHKIGLTSLNMECKVAPQNDTCKRIDVDFWGADIGHVTAESLDKCEELCRETEGCVSLTYRASSNSCWRKNKKGGQRGPTVQGGLVSMNMDCTDTKSDQSCLQENTDFWGADLASGRAINLDQCETFCRDTRDCVSITYRSSDSQCWLKYNRFGAAGPSHKIGLTSLNMECKVAPQNENCKRIDVDFWGADIGHVTAESLDKCEELCRETEGCVSLTYRASSNSCWRKNKRGGQRGPTVQGGLVSMNMDCTDTKSDQSCLQENTDFWGADLASGRAINLDQCETFCRDTRDCVSITYRSSDSQCWLKYNRFGAAGPSHRNGLTSLNMECKVAPQNDTCKRIDVDFWGADIGHVTAESLDKCEELCRGTEGCVSLTYRASSNSCWRKNKRGGQRGPTVQGGLVSMNMDCTDTKSDQSCLQENTDFWGADLASGRAINLDQCETFCRDTRDCVSITYRSSDSQCWLKYNRFGAAGPSHTNGLTSLNMECFDVKA